MIKAFLERIFIGPAFYKGQLQRKKKMIQVWNRNATKAQKLEIFGAVQFSEVKNAVAYAEIVHLALRDDASGEDVLSKASPGFKQDTTIVDHTTTSAEGAVERTAGMKLIRNLFLLAFTTGLSDALSLADSLDIAPGELLELFETTKPGTEVMECWIT